MTANHRGPAMPCPACDGDTTAGASYCQHCGHLLDDSADGARSDGGSAEGRPPGDAPAEPARSGDSPADAAPSDRATDAAPATPETTSAVPRGPDADAADPSRTSVMEPIPPSQAHRSPRAPRQEEGRRCPRCGAGNDDRREVCANCGADLETGATLAQPRSGGARSPNNQITTTRRRRRWWIPIVAVVAVVAAIVAAFWVAGLGPFASEPSVPEATFEASRYEGDPEPLLLTDIATVTTRAPEGDRTFTAAQMVDANPETAWHADVAALPSGVTEKVDLFLAEPAWIDQLVVNNGDHADSEAYEAAGRILRVELVLDGGRAYEVNLLDQGRQPQYVALPEPELTTAVRLEITESIAGTQREDIAVSDLELRGWPADADDTDLAQRRADVRPAAGPIVLAD